MRIVSIGRSQTDVGFCSKLSSQVPLLTPFWSPICTLLPPTLALGKSVLREGEDVARIQTVPGPPQYPSLEKHLREQPLPVDLKQVIYLCRSDLFLFCLGITSAFSGIRGLTCDGEYFQTVDLYCPFSTAPMFQ